MGGGAHKLLVWNDTSSPRDAEESDSFSRYCRDYDITSVAISANVQDASGYVSYIAIERVDAHDNFTEDQQALQEHLPALFDAWVLNHVWHLQSVELEPGCDAAAICGPDRRLQSRYPDFEDLLLLEFPDWRPGYVPIQLGIELLPGTPWHGERIIIEAVPVADVVLLKGRRRMVHDILSPREMEVSQSAARGMRYKEIASLLGVSPSTVRTHLYNSYRKLNVSSRASLVHVLGKH